MTSLELRQINKNYGAYHALRGIDLSVAQGEFIVMTAVSFKVVTTPSVCDDARGR